MELIRQFKQNCIRHPLWMSDIYEEKDMIHLKEMDWDDDWKNYIVYGKTHLSEEFNM